MPRPVETVNGTAHLQERSSGNTRATLALITESLLIVCMAAYLACRTLPAAWKTLNTDFSNYYLTAGLAREGVDTSRIYEWVWLQRQKDHREIDQRIISLVPITPFSTLAMLPVASKAPLQAKRYWLIANMAFVVTIAGLLRSVTQLSWRHTVLIMALSVPLNKNFLYGQYYVLLLFTLTLAYWCYVRERRFLSGVLVGVSFGLKLFPLLYIGYFLRKRDLKAAAGGIFGGVAAVIVSIYAFGWQAHRVLAKQVLPWVLRGEGMDPYNVSSASVATLFHRLFIYEPQWNPHPMIQSALAFALLLPLAQTLLFAPALLLVEPGNDGLERLHLEWSAILLGSLAVSTLPAGYHFTLLILPVCLIWHVIQRRFGQAQTATLLALYILIGYPGWKSVGTMSSWVLFSVPRLYFVVLLCVFAYWLLWKQARDGEQKRDTWLWVGVLVVSLLLNIFTGLRHQSGLYAEYRWRVPMQESILQAQGPVAQRDATLFTAMVPAGYRTAIQKDGRSEIDPGEIDQLAVAANPGERWTEETARESTILSSVEGREPIRQAESPVASPNGRLLAYLRERQGRNRIWLRALDQAQWSERELTPAEANVLEMSFLPNGSIVFSAEWDGERPRLFLVDQSGTINSLGPDEARYPAISPDGHWFAFSKLQSGNWHLWLRDLHNGHTSRLTDADCNNVTPSWNSDSRTLVYASDCGRALWFTALCRRRLPE